MNVRDSLREVIKKSLTEFGFSAWKDLIGSSRRRSRMLLRAIRRRSIIKCSLCLTALNASACASTICVTRSQQWRLSTAWTLRRCPRSLVMPLPLRRSIFTATLQPICRRTRQELSNEGSAKTKRESTSKPCRGRTRPKE